MFRFFIFLGIVNVVENTQFLVKQDIVKVKNINRLLKKNKKLYYLQQLSMTII